MRTSPDVIGARGTTIGVVDVLICSFIGSVLGLSVVGVRVQSMEVQNHDAAGGTPYRAVLPPQVTGRIWALLRQPLRKSQMLGLGNIFFFFQNALHNKIAARLQI